MDKPSFRPAFWQDLALENPLGRRDITEQDARDWFDWIWVVYRQRHSRVRAPNHKLRIARWWFNLSDDDIDRARARGRESRRGVAAERLTRVATKALPSSAQPLRKDLPPLQSNRGGERG